MENENIYTPPKARLVETATKETAGYGVWRRFYTTFLWGLPVYMFFVLTGTPEESWFMGSIGSVVLSTASGVIAMAIPVKRKSIYISVSLLMGIITAGMIGFYFSNQV